MTELKAFVNKHLILSQDDPEFLQDTLSTLLNVQFIRRGNEKDFEKYEFIRRNEELVRDILELCGLKLQHNRDYLFFYIATLEGRNRANLSQGETIILLILRLLYEEAMTDLKVISGEASVTNRELHEKYRAFINAERPMEKTQYKTSITALKRYRIIDYDGAFSMDADFSIRILPTILAVVDKAAIQDIENRLINFSSVRDTDA